MGQTTDERTPRDRLSFLRTLRAVRSFRPDPVPEEVVDDILEVARWSGSASNKQPWEILVIRGRDTLRLLALTADSDVWLIWIDGYREMLEYLDADDRAGFVERHRQIYRDYRARLETLLFEAPS